eukprot:s1714_g8.t1
MDRDDLEDCMWRTLCQSGLTGKKLAVYSVDDAEEITVQLCKKLGIVCELWHVDLVYTWINDAVRSEPVAKRLRGDTTLDPLDSKLLEERMNLSNQLSSSSSSNAVLVSVLPESRPSRRRAQDGGEEHARKLRDDQQKEMWSRELYLELKKIEAPALEHLEHCVNDRHLHMALAGRTRYNTLKRYVKTWMAFMQWLNAAKNVVEYPVPGDLVEYLFSRYAEPCGPTIPVLIVKAVTWFERVACLDVRARIGESHVVSSVRDYIVEMLSKDSAPTKRAPRYPAVFLESLEAMVDNETLVLGMRLIAWIKLVKIWASLRWDDIQKIIPKELKYYAGRMTTVLRITKTSGPTKRIQELPVCVSERSYVTSPFWLKTGFDLFKEHASFERDYLLPKLNKEWSGFRRSMALYNDISSYSSYVRKAAKRLGTSVPLVDATLATFWTEHSERATVPTGLALLRVEEAEVDEAQEMEHSPPEPVEAEMDTREWTKPIPTGDYINLRNAFMKVHGKVEDKVTPSKEYMEKKLQELENGEFRAELLSEVVSKDEVDPDTMVPVFDSKGTLSVKKGSSSVSLPTGPEQLRRRLSVMLNCILMLSLKHTNREEIQDMTRDVMERYKDYILGDYVWGLSSTDLQGNQIQSPPWSLILSYEHAVRKRAYSLMITDRLKIGAALEAAWKCPVTKERHFITPLALYAKRSHPPANWGDWNPKGKGKSNKGTSNKGKSKGKGAASSPDGAKICFRFNQGKCSYQKCKFAHICNRCFNKGHNALNCKGDKAPDTTGSV